MKKLLRSLALVTFSGLFAQGASAAVITKFFDITASNFESIFGLGTVPAIDPVSLRFTVTLDTAADVGTTTQGLTIFGTNLPYDFTYSYDQSSDFFIIGKNALGTVCTYGSGGACVFVTNFSTAPSVTAFTEYVGSDNYYGATSIAARIATVPTPVPVPEPASWAFMIGGFAFSGAALRRHRARRLRFA